MGASAIARDWAPHGLVVVADVVARVSTTQTEIVLHPRGGTRCERSGPRSSGGWSR